MKYHQRQFLATITQIIAVLILLCNDVTHGISITAQYPIGNQDFMSWTNLAIDPVTWKVYAGGVNQLYQFDENLVVIGNATTGPVFDNPDCYNKFTNSSCESADAVSLPASQTNNYNRVLVVDVKHNQLVTCGSVLQGTCQTRNLSNISKSTDYPAQLSQYVIVASRTYPTVAFVGPGPFGDDVLYVGATYEGKTNTQYLLAKYIAGVSSRNLTQPGTFLVTETDGRVTYGTYAYLTQDAATLYRITYVAGFSLNGFSYFLTRQPYPFNLSVVSNVISSKLVQVCQGDKYFDSYVEMRITCSSRGVDYNLIQAAAFVRPGSILARELSLSLDDSVLIGVFSTSNQSNFGSALCVYPLSDIRKTFTQNIQGCYDPGVMYVGPQFQSLNPRCSAYPTIINESYCGSMFQTISRTFASRNSPLVGTISLSSTAPALVLPGTNITALNATTFNDHTVLFMGTAEGKLLKVLLDSKNGTVYETSDVGKSAVNQDLLFNADKSSIYLMTSEKIFKIPVSNCQQYTTCDLCLSAKDPYCGWCSLENSCRQRSECPDNQLNNRWLFYSEADAICPSATINPLSADINADVNVTMTMMSLPELKTGEYYNCVFGSGTPVSRATVIGNQIICPMTQSRPAIPSSYDNVVILLSVQMSQSSTYFFQSNFTFYDCSHHSTCSSCSSAPWNCQWCIYANRCQNTTTSCANSSPVHDARLCPSLPPDSKEILIPVGIEKTLTLRANNLPQPQDGDKGYFCEMSLPRQSALSVPATRLNISLVSCSSHTYSISDAQPYTTSLRIVWGNNNFPVDGSYNVTVFNCSAMADGDCNKCLSLQYDSTAKYGCQWCGSTCQPNVSSCNSSPNDQNNCPRAVVTSINPQSGPIEGGTLVTISGTNLGYKFDRVAVYIGSDLCQGIQEKYVVSQQYVCVTRSVPSTGPRNINIAVANVSAIPDSQFATFVFKDPKVYDIKPNSGPQSGGTPVTLFGEDLDTGSNTSVFIGQLPCAFIRSNNSEIVCITTSSNGTLLMTSIRVQFDSAARILNKSFQYKDDPTLSNPVPSGSFKTGGCTVSVVATNLDSIVDISVQLSDGQNSIRMTVTFRNSSLFQFLSPMVSQSISGNVNYQLQLKLDGVIAQLPFTIFSDPVVDSFANGKRSYGGDTIQLSGRNMLVPCMDNYQAEVSVYVGSQMCNISSLTETNLYCKPPNTAPDGKTEAPVSVMVGSSLRFELGDLVYPGGQGSIFWPIIVGVIGGVLVVIIIVLIFAFCLWSSRNERQYGKLQAQMEALESGVRNECKQAFTELQTDVSDFTSDLNVIGIPFWDYRMYAFRLLFPMVVSHQVLYINTCNGKQLGEFDEKMHRFNQLLGSKYFLLTFIHTMEKQPQNFGITDRSKVASLLSVILIDKMDYATEIIKILLEELIVRSIEKRAPKLMLRRAETVVEKLLANWLSLSMYSYLKTHAGRALFMLYKAIKHQTEKGPIDAVTAEARYSLSEDRLLRENLEKLEAKTLSVTVYDGDSVGQPPVTCKMLDCDTITQAKEKALDAIHKNTPFSKRPSRNNVELRWNAGKHSDGYPADHRDFLPLNDQDVTTKTVDGWKRVNTLSHYYVSDGSVFQLRRNTRNESVHQVHGMIELESGTLLNTIRLDEGIGTKVWHLVKHDDAANNISRTQKVISEIFLTRLLSTKMTLQQYIDDLFTTILRVDSSLPPAVKYLYDFLDNAAQRHGITDSEVVHAWKSNSLPLRFWVNLIKNPEFIFDINKSPVVDCCLSIIAQTFMDSCSTHEHRLGKDSPSAKLLFAKDIPKYRHLVNQFYLGIRDMPAVTEDDMAATMTELSNTYSAEFNQEVALHELYEYALRFNRELVAALESDPSARKLHLAEHFEQLRTLKDKNPDNSVV